MEPVLTLTGGGGPASATTRGESGAATDMGNTGRGPSGTVTFWFLRRRAANTSHAAPLDGEDAESSPVSGLWLSAR